MNSFTGTRSEKNENSNNANVITFSKYPGIKIVPMGGRNKKKGWAVLFSKKRKLRYGVAESSEDMLKILLRFIGAE